MGMYTEQLPPNCPPDEATGVNATLFRACDSDPPTDEDFTSHVESQLHRKRRRADPAICTHWGLSVWTSRDDAAHAQQLLDWLKPKYIFSGDVRPADGKLAQTGKLGHHTFWPYLGVHLIERFEMSLPPIAQG